MRPAISTAAVHRKNDRKKVFNVIYFIDSSKTRSLKLPLPWLRVIIVIFLVFLLWTISSFFTIYNLLRTQSENERQLQTYLSAIFSYQSRYDHVFEKAYPELTSRSTSLAATEVEKPVAKPVVELAAAPTAKKEAPAVKEDVTATDDAEPSKSIQIEKPDYKIKDDKLTLRFSLRNNEANTKAEGYVWGVAKFNTTEGENIYVGAPEGINVATDGEPSVPRASYRYSIKYYKIKDLSFAAPEGKSGRFENIQIVIMDKDGQKIVREIPVTSAQNISGVRKEPPIANLSEMPKEKPAVEPAAAPADNASTLEPEAGGASSVLPSSSSAQESL